MAGFCSAVDTLLASTPVQLLQDFVKLREADLLAGQHGRSRAIAGGTIMVTPGATPLDTMLDAARLLRALEQVALQFGRYIESDHGTDLEDAFRSSDGLYYVVPRLAGLEPLDGKPFLRRALLHHRILPTRVDSFQLRLHRAPTAPADPSTRHAAPTRTRYGAAFFPGLAAAMSPGDGDFIVDRISGFEAQAELDRHIAEAQGENCVAVVWAELTMPEEHLGLLQAILAREALAGRPACDFHVAGSWHRIVEGEMRNIGVVLDGMGERLFDVVKWAKFAIGARREAIAPGDSLPVLIGQDRLTVFAICRDFLEDSVDTPYRALNVDVAIVPSMSASIDDRKTINGHASAAKTMRIRFGTRTLVVVQPASPGVGAVGQMLSLPHDPQLQPDGDLVFGHWASCDLEQS